MTPIRRNGRIFKYCAVCRTFHDWRAMRFDGYHDDGVERLEQRTCAAGNTLSVVMAYDEAALRQESEHDAA